MALKRIVNTEFWSDDKVIENFSPEDKLFFLYLLTNPHTTQLGIYKINKKIMSFELGYSIETISILLDRFENKYKIIKYSNETSEIAIKNYLKHSIVKGGKPVEDCLMKEIKNVKNRALLNYIYLNIKDYDNLNETVNNIINNNINIFNEIYNDNDNDVSYHDTSNDTIQEYDIQELFKQFWKAYPKKRDKGKAEKWFETKKPSKELVELMIAQIDRFKKTNDWNKENGKYIPYPYTWLNAKAWEDEFETEDEREERIIKKLEEKYNDNSGND